MPKLPAGEGGLGRLTVSAQRPVSPCPKDSPSVLRGTVGLPLLTGFFLNLRNMLTFTKMFEVSVLFFFLTHNNAFY